MGFPWRLLVLLSFQKSIPINSQDIAGIGFVSSIVKSDDALLRLTNFTDWQPITAYGTNIPNINNLMGGSRTST